jgi:hypothetical protein
VGARFSAPVQNVSESHPASYTTGTGSFPGLKRPECDVDHPPPSNVGVKERVELYLYPPLWAFVASSRVNFTFTFTLTFSQNVLQLLFTQELNIVYSKERTLFREVVARRHPLNTIMLLVAAVRTTNLVVKI